MSSKLDVFQKGNQFYLEVSHAGAITKFPIDRQELERFALEYYRTNIDYFGVIDVEVKVNGRMVKLATCRIDRNSNMDVCETKIGTTII